MRILVTGASGFAGSLLVPRLLKDGHELRTLARDPSRVPSQPRVVRGDAISGEGLAEALEGVEVAYYLIHSMERANEAGARFEVRERAAAETFAAAARRAGTRRIVYLGGLLPHRGSSNARSSAGAGVGAATPLSRHLASRVAVERILLSAVADSVALRASIVIGARSRSFRLLVRLVERLPVLTLPSWRRFRTQPIDARDVIEMLAAAASAPLGGRSLDVGGPDVLSYGEMLARIAELMLLRRPSLGLRLSATPLTGRVAAAIAQEDPALVLGLMGSLKCDLLPADDHAAELLGVRLHSFDCAVEHALREWEEHEPLAAR